MNEQHIDLKKDVISMLRQDNRAMQDAITSAIVNLEFQQEACEKPEFCAHRNQQIIDILKGGAQ